MERSKESTIKKTSPKPIPTQSKYNNNKHNMEEFYKIFKKYTEIRLKNIKWTWTIEKWKIIHPPPYSFNIAFTSSLWTCNFYEIKNDKKAIREKLFWPRI